MQQKNFLRDRLRGSKLHFSSEYYQALLALLAIDPSKRVSASQALQLPFFASVSDGEKITPKELIDAGFDPESIDLPEVKNAFLYYASNPPTSDPPLPPSSL